MTPYHEDNRTLPKRTILVAGATGRIGRAVCQECARLGARIVAIDLAEDALAELETILPHSSVGTHFFKSLDLTDEAQVRSLKQILDQQDLYIDGLVHSIGLTSHSQIDGYVAPFEKQTLAAWNAALSVNLGSAFTLAQVFGPSLKKAKDASAVFISSIYGSRAPDFSLYEGTSMGNPIAYGASKGGLNQLVSYLASIWAPNVRVNAISPGGIFDGQPQSFVKQYESRCLLKRMAHPEDIAPPVTFLLSDAARYITGQNIFVDGGWTAL